MGFSSNERLPGDGPAPSVAQLCAITRSSRPEHCRDSQGRLLRSNSQFDRRSVRPKKEGRTKMKSEARDSRRRATAKYPIPPPHQCCRIFGQRRASDVIQYNCAASGSEVFVMGCSR